MNYNKANLPLVYLHPGEYRFSEAPEVITTILGSCISLTMYVKRLRIGAITHSVLPDKQNKTGTDSCDENQFKYVDESIYNMLAMFDRYNVNRNEIEIKIFGGADLLSQNNQENLISIGTQNIKSALKILNEENLTVSASDLGGIKGRKLFFFTDTGEIYLKHLGK